MSTDRQEWFGTILVRYVGCVDGTTRGTWTAAAGLSDPASPLGPDVARDVGSGKQPQVAARRAFDAAFEALGHGARR